MSVRISLIILSFVLLVGSQQLRSQSKATSSGFDLVDATGNIRKPLDYRDHYPSLGTFVVLDPTGGIKCNTYASPGTAEYYRKTGKYADGTVLVKEVFGTDHAQLTTGDAHWATDRKSTRLN